MRYILCSDSLTAFVKGKPYTVNKTAEIYNAALQAIKAGSEEAFLDIVQIKKKIVNAFDNMQDVVIANGQITCQGREITGLLARRAFEMLDEGLDLKPMVNFIKNLMQNPSKRAVDETFGFVDACKLPITEDGHILAYKRVRHDYKDVHSATFDNSVGKVVEMPRNAVDEDKNRTCSTGLHFCSYDYLKHFSGDRIMVLKINPADIVSIPVDYNNAKGRTCKYEVIDEIPVEDYNGRLMPVKQIDMQYAKNLKNLAGDGTSRRNYEIKQDLANGMSIRNAAKKYNLSRRQIARVRDAY